MQAMCARLVNTNGFQAFIIGTIIVNAIILGLETSPDLNHRYGALLSLCNDIVLGIFIIEAIMKMVALSPKPLSYFKDGWNIFDFSIILISLIPMTGSLATVARLARLLRVMRLISAFPQLRLIVSTLIHSIPGMANVILLMSVLFYIYAVAGYHLFHDIDPTHWASLGLSLLTLFRIVTLEDWTDVMYAAMEANSWYWIYFVSFVVLGTFVIVNLFIAVVLNNLEEAKHEKLEELVKHPENLLQEINETMASLQRLQQQLAKQQHELSPKEASSEMDESRKQSLHIGGLEENR